VANPEEPMLKLETNLAKQIIEKPLLYMLGFQALNIEKHLIN
jgi:hypothetical protein